MKIEQAVILAGGLGTRLKPFTVSNPKPMITFEERPFIDYLLYQVKAFGINEVILLLGYLPEVIEEHLSDGSEIDMKIIYDITPVEYDTGARLKHAAKLLKDKFLLLYCDNYCPLDFHKMLELYDNSNTLIQITVYANKDGYTKDNLLVGSDNLVKKYDKSRKEKELAGVDIGYAIVNKCVLDLLTEDNVNFEKAVYPDLVKKGKLGAYITEHRYYSIGSWERIELTRQFFKPRKVIFLDRDGTLNEKAPKAQYIETPEQFKWLVGAKEAIKRLKENQYTIILVTNQPGIARKMVEYKDVEAIHEKMQKELDAIGAGIDYVYMCPHGWEENCACRKPKPGMLYQAQKDLSLNLQSAILIGDDERDVQAGILAGCKTIQVSDEFTLYQAVDLLLKK